MPQTLIAYAKSVLSSGTLAAITPVPDPTVTITDNDVSVPANYNQVVRAAGSSAGTLKRSQLQSPSLRSLYFPDLNPLVSGAASYSDPFGVVELDANPLKLTTNEGLEYWSDGGGNGTTAQYAYGLVFLSDGPIAATGGNIVTIRGTLAAAAAAATWNSSAITFDQTLPVGTYAIVGGSVIGAGLVAGRLIFIGPSAVTRPGFPAQNAETDLGLPSFRRGRAGVLGTFPSTNPPSVEVLGGTSSSQVLYLDLIKQS